MDRTQLNSKANQAYTRGTANIDSSKARDARPGDIVAVGTGFERDKGVNRLTIPEVPVPVVGTVVRTNSRSRGGATVRLPANAAGEQLPTAVCKLQQRSCAGLADNVHGLQLAEGQWVLLHGAADINKMPIGVVIGRRKHRDFLGRPTTTWRVRQVGFGPDGDITASADEIGHMFGADGHRALAAAVPTLVDAAD